MKFVGEGIRFRLKTVRLLHRAVGVSGTISVLLARLKGAKRVSVRVKGYDHPIVARMNNCDLPIITEILCSSECELDLAWEPRTILDLGANIGLASIKLSRQFPGANIIAVEPDRDTADVCRLNLSHVPRVEVLQRAVGVQSGRVVCINPSAPSISHQFEECALDDPRGIETISISELLARLDCKTPVLVKMDIEGAEALCFRSPGWLRNISAILVEPHNAEIASTIHSELAHAEFVVTQVAEKLLGQRASASAT
jgi:FkbM family methyltransferase